LLDGSHPPDLHLTTARFDAVGVGNVTIDTFGDDLKRFVDQVASGREPFSDH
jgi:hypothetical protein